MLVSQLSGATSAQEAMALTLTHAQLDWLVQRISEPVPNPLGGAGGATSDAERWSARFRGFSATDDYASAERRPVNSSKAIFASCAHLACSTRFEGGSNYSARGRS